ncbi:MAG: hypothetical protein FWB74_04595 [Defluviitaleaceae bacterium]|nr:hypothetical protein [Defluviitaleaceae bacterium]
MVTDYKMQTFHRDKLYSLLALRSLNKGYKIIGLDDMVNAMEAIMQEEDVAWVEKKIRERHGKDATN